MFHSFFIEGRKMFLRNLINTFNSNRLLKRVPNELKRSLWIKGREKIKYNSKNIKLDPNTLSFKNERIKEPSLILKYLPIKKCDKSRSVGYYPKYETLDSCQRFIYLRWLSDISQKIDIGFVYLYYYGLERRLFLNDFISTIKKIDTLRKYHKDDSFLYHSSQAIIATCLRNNRLDLLDELETPLGHSLLFLYLKIELKRILDPDDLMYLASFIGFKKNKIIKDNPELFKSEMAKILLIKFNKPFFIISENLLNQSKSSYHNVFLNYSFDEDLRRVTTRDILSNKKMTSEFIDLLDICAKNVSLILKEALPHGAASKNNMVEKTSKEVNTLDYELGEEEILKSIKSSSNFIERHFSYVNAFEFYYKFRSLPGALEKAERYALYDVEHIKNNLENIKEFLGHIPTFTAFNRLSIIYEKQNKIADALVICKTALGFIKESEKEFYLKKIRKFEMILPKTLIDYKNI